MHAGPRGRSHVGKAWAHLSAFPQGVRATSAPAALVFCLPIVMSGDFILDASVYFLLKMCP